MRSPSRSIPTLLLSAVAAGLGCREEPSLTGPESAPAPYSAAVVAAVVSPLSLLQVSAGQQHACGVATDGRAWCWGYAGNGQLGNGNTGTELCGNSPCSKRPVAVLGGLRFRHVSAGWDFTCGVTTDDRIYCWGQNDLGQLGTATLSRISTTPVAVAGNRRYRQVRAGGSSACAITMARTAFCWGANNRGQLGNGTGSGSQVPVRVSGGALLWAQLTIGFEHACGVTTDGRARCWGVNILGELGDGSTSDRATPTAVAGGLRFAQIEGGPAHTCAVTTAGRGYCWGSGMALGDGSTGEVAHLTPNPIAGNRVFANVSSGANQSCGVTVSARGFCWGLNAGTLGDGGTANRVTPALLAGGLSFIAVSVGGAEFSCGVATDARAWCWGQNLFGNLGDGTDIPRSVPTPVAAPAP